LADKTAIHIAENIPPFAKKAIENCLENFAEFCHFNHFEPDFNINIGIYGHSEADLYVSEKFIQLLTEEKYHFSSWFDKKPLLIDNDFEDYIGTCFYMINCLQEYAENVEDELGRFEYTKSYQHHFDVAHKNLVAEYFKIIAQKIGINHAFNAQSQLLLTHDIDIVRVKKTHIKHLLKKGKIGEAFKTFIGKKDIDFLKEIIDFEEKNQLKAIYFWLPIKGKSSVEGIQNADYDIYDEEILEVINSIAESKLLENALHKSISDKSLDDERALISNKKITKNRFHFLKFNVKNDFETIEKSDITDDYSLGFSHAIGFRNSYGLPFKPYSPVLQKQFNLKVHPLNIMDSTLIYYTHGNFEKKKQLINDFLEQNRENCEVVLLWHNNYLSLENFNNYRKLFENIAMKYTKTTPKTTL
jgi:hypothetical protein